MKTTRDDGKWKLPKRSGQFWSIHLPIPPPKKTKTLVRKLERNLIKLYRQNVSLACLTTLKSSDRMKQICLWITIYIYIYIYSPTPVGLSYLAREVNVLPLA